MRSLAAVVTSLLSGCAAAGCAAAPQSHLGPVTGLCVVGEAGAAGEAGEAGAAGEAAAAGETGEEVYACSQAGVATPGGWLRPAFRPVALDTDAGRVLVGGGEPGESGWVALYARDGSKLAERRVAGDLVYAVALRPGAGAVAIGCADGSVKLLRTPDLLPLRALTAHTAPCRAVRFSPDGERLATGGLDGLVYVHSLGGGTTLTIKDHTAGVESLLFRGRRLYSGARDGNVRIHELGTASARLVRTYQGMRDRVLALCAEDATHVLAGLRSGRILRLAPDDATYAGAFTVEDLFVLATHGLTIRAGTRRGVVRIR